MRKISLLFLFLAAAVRFVWLDRFPPGITNDELEYDLSAESYLFTGRDISGYGLPLSLVKSETRGVVSPLPAILAVPFQLLPGGLAVHRLMYTLVNLLSISALIFLAYRLTRNLNLSLVGGILFAVSPWGMFLSRNVIDSALALMFVLWALYFMISRRPGLSFLFFVLTFFSYHATKILLPPAIILLFAAGRKYSGRTLSLFLLAFLAGFIVFSRIIPGSVLTSRSSELIFSGPELPRQVDDLRRATVENSLNSLFINKAYMAARTMLSQYLAAFSPGVLFTGGDSRTTYRYEWSGLLLWTDLLLVPVGLTWAYMYHRRLFWLALSLLILGPLPTAVSNIETSVVNRSFVVLPGLILFGAVGFYHLARRAGPLVWLPVLLLWLSFLHFYFFIYPVNSQESFLLSERILSRYLTAGEPARPFVVVANDPREFYKRYIFFARSGSERAGLLRTPLAARASYLLPEGEITSDCPVYYDPGRVYILPAGSPCPAPGSYSFSLIHQRDSGEIFRVYQDPRCRPEQVSYRRYSYVSDYSVENMSFADLCSRWTVKSI